MCWLPCNISIWLWARLGWASAKLFFTVFKDVFQDLLLSFLPYYIVLKHTDATKKNPSTSMVNKKETTKNTIGQHSHRNVYIIRFSKICNHVFQDYLVWYIFRGFQGLVPCVWLVCLYCTPYNKFQVAGLSTKI